MKRNKNKSTMNQVLFQNKEITYPKEILKLQADFYEDLYSEKACKKEEEIKAYLQQVETKTLNSHDKAICEGLLTVKECESVLKTMKNNKSPGNDGISVEFYKKFWGLIGSYLVDAFNESYLLGEMSPSQRQAVITLIDKGKDRTLLKNWRPFHC